MANRGKGSAFERELSKKFSLWWTEGERDDIFWRTSNSGGRAKVRSRNNQKTKGQYGDIQAVDPLGDPLFELCTVEIKRGYGKVHAGDILDCGSSSAIQLFEYFLAQVKEDSSIAEVPYWILITKRDKKKAVLTMPLQFFLRIRREQDTRKIYPLIKSKFFLRTKGKKKKELLKTISFPLEVFFEEVNPGSIEDIAWRLRRNSLE